MFAGVIYPLDSEDFEFVKPIHNKTTGSFYARTYRSDTNSESYSSTFTPKRLRRLCDGTRGFFSLENRQKPGSIQLPHATVRDLVLSLPAIKEILLSDQTLKETSLSNDIYVSVVKSERTDCAEGDSYIDVRRHCNLRHSKDFETRNASFTNKANVDVWITGWTNVLKDLDRAGSTRAAVKIKIDDNPQDPGETHRK